MSITVECPFCKNKLKAPERLAGKAAKCPGCQAKVIVPIPENAITQSLDVEETDIVQRNENDATLAAGLEQSNDEPEQENVDAPLAVIPESRKIEFKSATCPNCGGNLQLDPSNEKGICPFCKSEIVIAEAIQKFKGEVEGIATSKNRLTRAEQMVSGGDYDGAIKLYKALLEADPENHEAWWGFFSCDIAIAEFHFNRSSHSNAEKRRCISSYREAIEQRGEWAVKYAPSDKIPEYQEIIEEIKNKIEILSVSPEPEKTSRCYIATAVYGSSNAPEVLFLRRYRDEVLSKSSFGRLFIKTYYFLSPSIARRLQKTKRLNFTVKVLLDKYIQRLKRKIGGDV